MMISIRFDSVQEVRELVDLLFSLAEFDDFDYPVDAIPAQILGSGVEEEDKPFAFSPDVDGDTVEEQLDNLVKMAVNDAV